MLGWIAVLTIAAVAGPVGSANSAVQILAGSGGPNPSENVLFNNNPPDGLTVQGITNASTLVDFTGNETLHAQGGQSKLDALDGAFSLVSWVLNTPNSGYTDLKFSIIFPDNPNTDGQDTGTIHIDILNQFGAHTTFDGTLSSNGGNTFQAHATLGDLITKVTLTGDPWTELREVRISADPDITAAVPELSTWAMMLIGFAGLGFMGYRRARKLSAA